jgi:hypothetical protein
VDNEGGVTDVPHANYEAECLVFEWFDEGVQLAFYDLRRRQRG